MLKDRLTITYNLDEVADSLDEGIRFLVEHGISSAEVRTIDGKNIAKLTLKETEEFKSKLDANGLSISSVASPLFKWYSGNQESESKADLFGMSPHLSQGEKKELIVKIIEQACILNTTKVRIFSGLKPDKGDFEFPAEESELLQYALGVAKEKSVQLMLENEPVCYISKLKDYIEMFTSGKYEGLHAWFDVANVYEEGENITYSDMKQLAPYVGYLHVKDPIEPQTHKYAPLGEGYVNYKRIFDVFEHVLESPVHLSIETHVKDDKWNASHKSLEYLHRLLNTRRTKYALVGLGRVSNKHIQALSENDNCTLMGVFDIVPDKAMAQATDHDCSAYETYGGLLDDDLVDVVSICTPHNTHIELAAAAINKQKRVLCEKPLALDSDSLEHYISTIDTNDSTHLVFQNKFNPAVKKFYEYEREELGDLQYIAMTLRWWRDVDYYKDWHGSQELSGGPLITQAIHSLELVTYLTRGAAIKGVTAKQMKTREDISLPDVVIALVEFDNGVVANIEVCLATHDSNLESSIFAVGTKRSVKVSGVALSKFEHPTNDAEVHGNEAAHYYGNGHSELYRVHSDYCLSNPRADFELLTRPVDVVGTLELIEAIESVV